MMTRGDAGAALALPADAVVLSADEAADLSDRVYQVRCAAEDVATALDEGASVDELRELCDELLRAARAADAGAEWVSDRLASARRVKSRHGRRAWCTQGYTGPQCNGNPAHGLSGRIGARPFRK